MLHSIDEAAEADLEWFGTGLGEALRDGLGDAYADAAPADLDDVAEDILASMSPAESFNFASALQQIGRGASGALADPTINQIVRAALPVAAGAAGTMIGGPLGTAVGTNLGTLAANALPATRQAAPPSAAPVPAAPAAPPAAPVVSPQTVAAVPAVPVPQPTAGVAPLLASAAKQALPVAGGSASALQGLILTQQPDALKAMLAAAMGSQGRSNINGVPVAALLGMLSSVFGQAAEDVDSLMYAGEGEDWAGEAAHDWSGVGEPVHGRGLYTTLLDADNFDLAEAFGDVDY